MFNNNQTQTERKFFSLFLLCSQAQNLLEEARNENRMLEESVTMLKEQVNMFELEVEQIQEQAKIKESNFEEEIGMLKDQLKERNYQDVAENIELIRLQQDKKAKMTQLSTMKAQIQGLEEQVHKLKSEADKLKNENTEMSTAFAEEQRKSIHLTSELSNNSSSKQVLRLTYRRLERFYKKISLNFPNYVWVDFSKFHPISYLLCYLKVMYFLLGHFENEFISNMDNSFLA